MLDVTCIYAAACDLAMAEPEAVGMAGIHLVGALFEMHQRAHKECPREGMLAIMDFQHSRVLSFFLQVQ